MILLGVGRLTFAATGNTQVVAAGNYVVELLYFNPSHIVTTVVNSQCRVRLRSAGSNLWEKAFREAAVVNRGFNQAGDVVPFHYGLVLSRGQNLNFETIQDATFTNMTFEYGLYGQILP